MRILMVCSTGGHLSQLVALKPWWEQHDRLWVTFDTTDSRSLLADESVVYGYSPTTRNVPNLVRNSKLARKVLAAYQPDLVFSNGAGMAVPYFYLARQFGARTSYLEVIDRIDTASLTGRLVYPVTDDFLVQWPEQQRLYPKSAVMGLVY